VAVKVSIDAAAGESPVWVAGWAFTMIAAGAVTLAVGSLMISTVCSVAAGDTYIEALHRKAGKTASGSGGVAGAGAGAGAGAEFGAGAWAGAWSAAGGGGEGACPDCDGDGGWISKACKVVARLAWFIPRLPCLPCLAGCCCCQPGGEKCGPAPWSGGAS